MGTFRGDIKQARRWPFGPRGNDRWSAKEKSFQHRRFRRLERQLLRMGQIPPTRLAVDYIT